MKLTDVGMVAAVTGAFGALYLAAIGYSLSTVHDKDHIDAVSVPPALLAYCEENPSRALPTDTVVADVLTRKVVVNHCDQLAPELLANTDRVLKDALTQTQDGPTVTFHLDCSQSVMGYIAVGETVTFDCTSLQFRSN